jgi:hypothetical protein
MQRHRNGFVASLPPPRWRWLVYPLCNRLAPL